MIPLPTWMRRALFATAVMNFGAAAAFLPAATWVRGLAGFPAEAHPFYLLTVGMFILLFGLGYLWSALVGRADRLFIAICALGKVSFVVLLVHLWNTGELPLRAPLTGSPDLVFGALFAAWLLTARAPVPRPLGAPAVVPAPERGSASV